MAESHCPEDFGELAYLAVTSEGLDEIAKGPAPRETAEMGLPVTVSATWSAA